MKSIRIILGKVATIVACLAATTSFASCEPADEPTTGVSAFVEFSFANQRGTSVIDAKKRTVKAVAECGANLASLIAEFKLSPDGVTATVDGKPQESGKTANNFTEAVVYTLATPGGETAEWTVTITLPDDCPQVKKYITYNKPVKEYFVEYKQSNPSYTYAEACESRKYAYTYSGNGEFTITYISGGQWLIYVYPSKLGGYVWGIDGTDDDYFGSSLTQGTRICGIRWRILQAGYRLSVLKTRGLCAATIILSLPMAGLCPIILM